MATIAPLKVLTPYKEVSEKEVWGPIFWMVFHKKAKEGFTKNWLDKFEAAIHCPDCKEHFKELRVRFPIKIFKHEIWAWLVHNMVNTERSNKPFFSWEEYKRKY